MSHSRSRLPPPALRWVGGPRGYLSLIEQTLLPGRLRRLSVRDVPTLFDAIRRLAVRGAPAIGVAAGFGVILAAQEALPSGRSTRARRRPVPSTSPAATSPAATWLKRVETRIDYLATSRPTAVNLFWALDRMRTKARSLARSADLSADAVLRRLLEEAQRIQREDEDLCRAIGRHGARLLQSGWSVLTHCNAGALATAGSGTALSVVYEAVAAGKRISVYADETRPLLQGARLTAWELRRAGIEVTVLCDNAAASLLAAGRVQAVVVGADRIAANGDVANKIGTLGVALLAKANGIPFYVAAPSTTFDLSVRDGAGIPIEERAPEEVVAGFGTPTAPTGVKVYNPAFDVTPARYVSGIITERGVLRAPYRRSIRKVLGRTSRSP